MANAVGCDAPRTTSHRDWGNHSFTLTTEQVATPQEFHRIFLAPLLSNIYSSDLPITISRKYAYTDDLAAMHAGGDWQTVEGVLNKDMTTVAEYLYTWKFKLSITKMVLAAFHIKKKAKCELKVNYNNKTLLVLLWAHIPWSKVGQDTQRTADTSS